MVTSEARDDGYATAPMGDDSSAWQRLQSLAEPGDAVAQNDPGVLYDDGGASLQDDAVAVIWS